MRIRTSLYGELAPSLALPLRKQGEALLQKIRVENQAFDASAAQSHDEQGTNNKHKQHLQKKHLQPAAAADSANAANVKASEAAQVQHEETKDSVSDSKNSTSHAKTHETEDGDDDDADEDAGDERIAWESLETARKINEQHGHSNLEQAEVYLTLGDLGLEQSQFDQAKSDLQNALNLYQTSLAADDRRLADVLHRMSLTCQFNELPAEALEHATNAQRVLERRLENLQQQEKKEDEQQQEAKSEQDEGARTADDTKEHNTSEPHYNTDANSSENAIRKEVDELQTILGEVRERVQELESDARKYEQTKQEISKVFSNMFGVSVEQAQQQQDSHEGTSHDTQDSSHSKQKQAEAEQPRVQNLGVVGKSAGKRKITPQPDEPEQSKQQKLNNTERSAPEEASDGKDAADEEAQVPPTDTEDKPAECKQQ